MLLFLTKLFATATPTKTRRAALTVFLRNVPATMRKLSVMLKNASTTATVTVLPTESLWAVLLRAAVQRLLVSLFHQDSSKKICAMLVPLHKKRNAA